MHSDAANGGCSVPLGGGGGELRCTYAGCDRPHQSTRFHRVEAGQTAGGRNWDLLSGSILCHACYCQYLKRGTLERTKNKPIAQGLRRCTLIGCERPDYGIAFYQIESGKNAGGRDWSMLTGNVLCSACYQRFLRSGTLKGHVRPRNPNDPLLPMASPSPPNIKEELVQQHSQVVAAARQQHQQNEQQHLHYQQHHHNNQNHNQNHQHQHQHHQMQQQMAVAGGVVGGSLMDLAPGAMGGGNSGLIRTKVGGILGAIGAAKTGGDAAMADQKRKVKEGAGSVGRKVKSRKIQEVVHGQKGQAALDLLCAVCVEQGSM